MVTTSSASERDALQHGGLEALTETRDRRRVALGIAVAAGAGAGMLGFGGAYAGSPSAAAVTSPGAISAFLARAQRAADGRYSMTYQVTIPQRGRAAGAAVVSASQLSKSRTVYRETPAFSLPAPSSSTPGTFVWRTHSYEVFNTSNPGGIVACTQRRPSSPWSCLGASPEIGMGGINQLLGPYPPQALVRGLQNAIATYTGKLAIKPEPVLMLTRRVAGQKMQCLQFGGMTHPLGSVCLNPHGVIASYQLPAAVTYSTYATAALMHYSANVSRRTFSLPAPLKPNSPPTR